MGRPCLVEREGQVYKCAQCNNQVAHPDELMEENGVFGVLDFTYEFHKAFNVAVGDIEVPYNLGAAYGFEITSRY